MNAAKNVFSGRDSSGKDLLNMSLAEIRQSGSRFGRSRGSSNVLENVGGFLL